MFLLDTVTVSELRKVGRGDADSGVATWDARTLPTDMSISVVTILELEIGVARAERSDPRRGEILRRWLDDVLPAAFGERVLPVTQAVARQAAAYHVPDPAPMADALVAATAAVHGLTVVTRNVRHFARFPGVRVLDPWSGSGQPAGGSQAGPAVGDGR